MNYDIIGDVHGQYDKLVSLLLKLGYRERSGCWRQPDHIAIFVGDIIDRGPKQLATVDLVRRMVEAGAARCILGNHELNAISWATPDPKTENEYLRRHARPSNRVQHQAFLAEVEGKPLHAEIINWFKNLPLWLDFGNLRVVHACWDGPSMNFLSPGLAHGNVLTEQMILLANERGHPVSEAVEILCKGMEMDLPEGISFHDKDGVLRTRIRVKWWEPDADTYQKIALAPSKIIQQIPDTSIPKEERLPPYSGPPVLFGHYWRVGSPSVISQTLACVDYSAGVGGALVAYRWEGEKFLSNDHFVASL